MPVITRRASPQEARYTPAGGLEKCGACRHFVSQGACTRVLGPISPRGWCKYFAREMVWHGGGVVGSGSAVPTDTALDLNFLTMPTLDPRITFTRASTATYFDATGTMQTAAVNAARFDYDPVTHAARGLLVEEQRTNLLLNSATLGTQSVTTTAVATTLSFYGTGTVTMSGTFTGSLVGTGAFPTRVSQTFTPTAGTLTLTVTGSVLNAQVEAGAFATSYIPTTSAAVTRAADVATASSSPWYNTTAGTLVSEQTVPMVPAAGSAVFAVPCEIDGGNQANCMGFFFYQANLYVTLKSGSTTEISVILGPGVNGAVSKVGIAATAGAQIACLNGGAITSYTAANMPVSITTIRFGTAAPTTNYLNGYVRRVRYWSRALSNIELMAATT